MKGAFRHLHTLRKGPLTGGEENIPQRLKPKSFWGGYGTAGSRAPSKLQQGLKPDSFLRLSARPRSCPDTRARFSATCGRGAFSTRRISPEAVRWCPIAAVLLLVAFVQIAVAQPVPLPPGTSSDQPQQPQQQKSDPLEDVESAIEAKNYPLASSHLEIYLSAHPDDARALFDRGYVEDAQGHSDAAEGWYRKAIAADPKITARQREALLNVYRSFRDSG